MSDSTPAAPIAVALDAPDLDTACGWAQATAGIVSTVKVGLETYLRDGAAGVERIRQSAPQAQLFLDLKLHDIPNTVAGAARSISALRPALLTVHALGGPAMIAAAAQAVPETRITAVTILTSARSPPHVSTTSHGNFTLHGIVALVVRGPCMHEMCCKC